MPRFDLARFAEIWRYYQAGIVNLAFGFGTYALFVRLGMNPFVAQAVAHVLGMAFNYLTYSRHVFRGTGPAKLRFVIAYAVNYVLSLAMLAALKLVIPSDYVAGLLAAIIVSLINYVALKFLVFRKPEAAA